MNSTLEQVVSGNLSVIDSRDGSVFYDASSMGHTGAPLPSLEVSATPTPEATYTPEPTATPRHRQDRHVREATKTPSPTETYTPEATPTVTITPFSRTSSIAVSPPETGSGGYLPQNHGGNETETAVILFALIAGTVANAAHGLYRHTVQSD